MGATVGLVLKSSGEVVQVGATDDDGYYFLPYGDEGKPAVYTVYLLGDPALSVDVVLNGNGFA